MADGHSRPSPLGRVFWSITHFGWGSHPSLSGDCDNACLSREVVVDFRNIAAYVGITLAGVVGVGVWVYAWTHQPPVLFDLKPGARYHSRWSGQSFHGLPAIDPAAFGLEPRPDLFALGYGSGRGRHFEGHWLQRRRDAVFLVCRGFWEEKDCWDVAVVKDRFSESE